MATQLRLRLAKILVINLGAVGTETVKNLVLGGINSLEILDGSSVQKHDFQSQFFLPKDAVVGELKLPLVINGIKDLNNRVNLSINTRSLLEVLQTEDYFGKFDLVLATELTKHEMVHLNNVTRKLNIPLYVAGVHGMLGYIFTDLIKHDSTSEKDVGSQPRTAGTQLSPGKVITKVEAGLASDKELVTICDDFSPLGSFFDSKKLPSQLNRRQMKRLSSAFPLIFSLFEVPKDELKTHDPALLLRQTATKICDSFSIPQSVVTDLSIDAVALQAYAEFTPTAAILGGALAQDVIQFLSGKESPINNCLILDAFRSEISIYVL